MKTQTPTRLILIRHGETEWNVAGRMQGHLDSPLTPSGEEQARAVGERLRSEEFHALYCSDLLRARQTAAHIPSHTEAMLDARLRERHLGIFQGLTAEEAQRMYPDEFQQFRTRAPDHMVPGGESRRQVQRRVIAALLQLAQTHRTQTTLVVTHGGVLDVVYRFVRSLALDAPREHEMNNASLNYLSWSPSGLEIERWGDVAHLSNLSLDEI
jgi:probable phosphoglycerate mutase